MKRILLSPFVSLVIILLLSSQALHAQDYYVVVGAFAKETNAKKFTGYVKSSFYNAAYELKTNHNYYYVYILKTKNRDEAYSETIKLQHQSKYKDCWVYKEELADQQENLSPPPIETPRPAVDSAAQQKADIPEIKPEGKVFKFNVETEDGQPVDGEIQLVDFNEGHDMISYKINEYVPITAPTNNKPLSFICGIFGYNEVVKEVNYNNPEKLKDVVHDSTGAWVFHYKLEPLIKGDIAVMYHVYFYKDAVMMLPKSQMELDQLLAFMTSKPKYKIKIHGHCNKTSSKKMFALGESKNYFDLAGAEEKQGSANELSKGRAKALQSYLIDNGIEKQRVQAFGWGSQDMLVPPNSQNSNLNDRIEIEIAQD